MIQKLGRHKILWAIDALCALAAALIGVLNPGVYSKVVSEKIMPGVLSQDLMVLVAAIIILICTIRVKEQSFKTQIVVLGIIGCIFYGYGIYVIERVYNLLYPLYLTIFGLSFYTIVYGVANIRQEVLQRVNLPSTMRYVAIGFSLFIPVLFIPLWLSQLFPLLEVGQKIENTYSIYILDLCFIMPLFIIIAIMTIKKEGLGLVLTPALFIKGFTVLFPLVIGEKLKPLFDRAVDIGQMWFYLVLSMIFLVLTIVYLRVLKIID